MAQGLLERAAEDQERRNEELEEAKNHAGRSPALSFVLIFHFPAS